MKSTVPVGTGRRLRAALDARGLEGSATSRTRSSCARARRSRTSSRPDRVVIGAEREPDRRPRGRAVRAPSTARSCAPTSRRAEMIKLASNAFLATKISFINEIANVCEEVGADVEEVARGMGLDPRIGSSFLRPGVGFGGSLLPQGRAALKQLAGNTRLPLPAARRGDRGQRAAEAARRHQAAAPPRRRCAASGSRCWGLAFKPNTDDMREASSLVLAGAPGRRGRERRRATTRSPSRARTAAAPADGVELAGSCWRRCRTPTPP